MLPITVITERGDCCVRPTAGDLDELVRRIGGEDDHFLVVQHVPDLPDVFIQVLHDASGYTLEHREGPGDLLFQVGLPGPEPAITAITGWAEQASGWDDGLTWRTLDLGPADPVPPLDLPDDERADLEARVRLAITAGYATRAEVAELAMDYLVDGDYRPVSRQQATVLADRLWLERVREQEQWRGQTDPERLTEAFARLGEAGIVARENFACCHSCGMAEIGTGASPGTPGFVFFHRQCTEQAASGTGLSLYYGGFDGSPETTTAVGHQVVAAIQGAGLTAQWDGSASSTIEVAPLNWRKRLVGLPIPLRGGHRNPAGPRPMKPITTRSAPRRSGTMRRPRNRS